MAKSKRELLNIELARLKTALTYNRKTGEFIWRIRRQSHAGKVKIGSVAGTPVLDRDGGTHISIKAYGKVYRAHRLAWLFVKGKWPVADVDHKDGIRTHNWWTNLRPASRGQNNANRHKITSTNVSGKTGVSWAAHRNKWMSRINIDGKVVHLGVFDRDKLDDAVKARREAELKYWGEYAPADLIVDRPSKKVLKALKDSRPKSTGLHPRNKSGKEGVCWIMRSQQWQASINIDKRHVHLGVFAEDDIASAIKARRAAELKYLGHYLSK